GEIRVPVLAGDVFRRRVGVNGDDFRVSLDAGHGRMDRKRSKASAEALVALMVDWLITKEQHEVVGQRLLQPDGLRLAQGLAQIKAADLSANPRRQRPDCNLTHGYPGPTTKGPLRVAVSTAGVARLTNCSATFARQAPQPATRSAGPSPVWPARREAPGRAPCRER